MVAIDLMTQFNCKAGVDELLSPIRFRIGVDDTLFYDRIRPDGHVLSETPVRSHDSPGSITRS
ncbi:hypothetical protein SAMN05421752_10839 [Natronorubrum thiooxidans]|uniref:Uncharacterized protein n=2 Tax=Natronorubrum thiooxidans TaxID=308853 RepID=A0A1N7FSK9_9EURY|nr:hypothetical protein SAMN05421752_10839 [Natronorubrum thiooxidans]